MQPTYLPWSGYFNLMRRVDRFVFLDDAQYSKGSWHNRNRLLIGGEVRWITLPVLHSYQQPLNQVRLNPAGNWQRKHCNTIRANYARARYGQDLEFVLDYLQQFEGDSLSGLTAGLIRAIAGALGIEVETCLASSLDLGTGRSERLLEICRTLGCDSYLSPAGARDYLEQDGVFGDSGLSLVYQEFEPLPYQQFGSPDSFCSHLSVLDLIANTGLEGTLQLIDRGMERLNE